MGLAAQKAADVGAGIDEFVQVDAGLYVHAVQHIHHVFGSHIACGAPGIGAAAQAGDRAVVLPQAHLQRGQGVGQRLAVGVMEMARNGVDAVMLQRRLHGALHLARCAHADGVGHAHMLHADLLHQPRQAGHALGCDFALIRATHGATHRPPHGNAGRAGGLSDRRKALDALGNAAVDVLLAEGLAGRAEDHDLVRPVGQRRCKALEVGRQHRIDHALLARDAGHHLVVVRHLWHPLGRHIAGDLDVLQARVLQALHQADLDLGRYRRRLVLQAVTRADIDDLDFGRKAHGVTLRQKRGRTDPPIVSDRLRALARQRTSRAPRATPGAAMDSSSPVNTSTVAAEGGTRVMAPQPDAARHERQAPLAGERPPTATPASTSAWSGNPLIVTVAPNGAYKQPRDHAALPITADALAATARACLDAGAAMLHMHIRDAQGRHSLDLQGYRAAIHRVRQAVGQALVLQITSEAAGIYRAAAQIALVEALRPEAVSVGLREFDRPEIGEAGLQRFFTGLARQRTLTQIILYDLADLRRWQDLRARAVVPQAPWSLLFVLGRYSAGQTSSPRDLLPFV